MTNQYLLVFIFSLLAMRESHAGGPTLDEIVARHTAAVGGKTVIERVHSVEFSLNIVEPKFTVDGIYRADRRLRMRIDIYAGGERVFTEAYDGKKAWQMGGDGKTKAASPEGTQALRNGILYPGKLFGLHESAKVGHRLQLAGRETVDNISYYVLKLTTSEGDQLQVYIHPKSWLIERTRMKKALHPDVDPTEKRSETRFSDFRKIDGVMRAFQSVQVDLETGKIMQTTTVREIKTNPRLDDSLFIAPSTQ